MSNWSYDDYGEPVFTPDLMVKESEGVESRVLDKYGNPFILKQQRRIGFDLRPTQKTSSR